LRSHEWSFDHQSSYETTQRSITETHFGRATSNQDSSVLDTQGCKLFDSLMLWVCLATGTNVLLNFVQSRSIFKIPCIVSNTLAEPLSYSSRAPPLMSC
jgi:hypothetical protein